jgi:long-subunit acyl-CoA synthetase (AMP-forming)
MIVTTTGRNIHPEWIEAMVLADPRIARCAVIDGGPRPRAVLVPADDWLLTLPSSTVDAHVAALCASAPGYATPESTVVIAEAELRRCDLVTANGRLRRRAIDDYVKDSL